MPPDNKIQNKKVQTYAEDMADVIGSNKDGLIKKIIQEEEEKEIEKKNLSPESQKNKIFMVLGVTMILCSLGIMFYFLLTREVETVEVPPQFVPLIFTDKTSFSDVTDLSKDVFIETVYRKVQEVTVKKGGIEGIYLVNNKNVVGFNDFLSRIKSELLLPKDVPVVNDNFLIGAANDNTKDFFVLLRVKSFEDIFPQMRIWERKMFTELYGFFGIPLNAETNYLFIKDFEDGIIQNKNARILYGDDRSIVMMYIFVDDNHVLITNTEDATREVIRRLASSKVKK